MFVTTKRFNELASDVSVIAEAVKTLAKLELQKKTPTPPVPERKVVGDMRQDEAILAVMNGVPMDVQTITRLVNKSKLGKRYISKQVANSTLSKLCRAGYVSRQSRGVYRKLNAKAA